MSKTKKWIAGAGIFVVGIFLGVAGAQGGADERAQGNVKAETVTETVIEEVEVEKIVEVEKEVEKEVKVNVEVTPAVCADALRAADDLIGHGADVMGIMSDAMQGPVVDALMAASNYDIAGMERATGELDKGTSKIEKINKKISASDYLTLKDQCWDTLL